MTTAELLKAEVENKKILEFARELDRCKTLEDFEALREKYDALATSISGE